MTAWLTPFGAVFVAAALVHIGWKLRCLFYDTDRPFNTPQTGWTDAGPKADLQTGEQK